MARQLITRGPVSIREYVPDAAEEAGYVERRALVSLVRIIERGPDVQLQVHCGGMLAGTLSVLAQHEAEMVRRLCGEAAPEVVTIDRQLLERVMDAHEEACMSGQTLEITKTRRAVWGMLAALLNDHAELEQLKQGGG